MGLELMAHGIKSVQIDGDEHVIVCNCDWTSSAHASEAEATVEWSKHTGEEVAKPAKKRGKK